MTTGDPENYFMAHLKFAMLNEKYGKKIAGWVQEISAQIPQA